MFESSNLSRDDISREIGRTIRTTLIIMMIITNVNNDNSNNSIV